MKEEISEKIRLFYVALTRAKESMIMVLPKSEIKDINKESNGALDISVRLKYKSFADIMYSVKKYLEKYYKVININELNLTKDYLFTKEKNIDISSNDTILDINELVDNSKEITKEFFSKKVKSLIDKSTYNNMEYGTRIHEILEYVDFKNYKEISDKYINEKINNLLNTYIMKDIKNSNIYKELEFIYDVDGIEYHGIIDLMIECDDYINIIDYKLKDIDSKEYIEQLKGYKKYIYSKTNKEINMYLYSIMNNEIKEIS